MRAAKILGGTAQLARHLKVSTEEVIEWAAGLKPVPDPVLLSAVDVLLDQSAPRRTPSEAPDFGQTAEVLDAHRTQSRANH
jgi:hypothetical protein